MNLFIIPGNPPALHFYRLWAKEIRSEYGLSSVHISPYPRVFTKGDSFKYLNEVVAFHGKRLLSYHENVGGDVTVVGHSIGAWIALRLLREYDNLIKAGFLLTPFIDKPSWKAKAVLKSVRTLYQLPLVDRMLLKSRGLLEKLIQDMKYVTDDELRTCLSLAYHEEKVIGRGAKPLKTLKEMRDKLHMIYCHQDKWCIPQTVEEAKQWIPCESIDVKHDFITSKEQRALLARRLLREIQARSSQV